mgnify:CR=1 FL=1
MKKIHSFNLIIITCLTASLPIHAQFLVNGKRTVYDKRSNTYLINIPEKNFGKNYPATITLEPDSAWSHLKLEENDTEYGYTFKQVEADKTYQLQAKRGNQDINAKIAFTFLPIIDLQGNFGYNFANGRLSLLAPDNSEPIITLLKAKWRGGSTNTENRHKRNYKIKILNSEGKSQDISFLGMREDNNWILDAGQVDLFRVRNRIATELWNDMATKPYYTEKEPKAKSGVEGKVVEVILNNEYAGIYSLTEAMDRKEMKLKKYDDKKQEFHGQMWKSSSWDGSTFWEAQDNYDNTQECWRAFETKYPDIEDVNPTDYSPLYDAINLVANGDDETFKKEVSDYFDIPVLIDYQILLEMTNAIDNIGKNLYWAIYDRTKSKKLTLAIWDLDATVGQFYKDDPLHPDVVSPTNELSIKTFNIYNRLMLLNVDNYNQRVAYRYKELRKSFLSEQSLLERYETYYNLLKNSGAAQREEVRWSGDSDLAGNQLDFDKEIEYIKDWIQKRLAYLDSENSPLLTAIKQPSFPNKKNLPIYNIMGQKVSNSYKGIKIIKGKKYI